MYYDTLALIMDRGELNIEAIGIFEAQSSPEKRTQKLKIAEFF